MFRIRFVASVVLCFTILPMVARSQTPAQSAPAPIAPPPATRLEAFKPAAGTLVTLGYNQLGRVGDISVDVREIRSGANSVRGVIVEVKQSEYREERAFIDADEIGELIRGIDALLEIQANPTTFENFEVRYTTKGELEIVAFNIRGNISYAVQAGRIANAQTFINDEGLQRLRGMFVTAQERLAAR